LVAELKERVPYAEFSLKKSSGGAFEVMVDGSLVFSKKALGRHAKPGEVAALLSKRLGEGP
jgi:selenoprotein W-related protein